MADLPVCSGEEAVRVFVAFGWTVQRQRGSHVILTKPGSIVSLSVPDHRELARGTLRKLIRFAGLTVEEFTSAL